MSFRPAKKKNSEGDVNKSIDNQSSLFSNPEYLLSEAKKVLNADVKFATVGKFTSDTTQQVVAGIELNNKKDFGIVFALLTINDGKLSLEYMTPLLDGAFEKSIVHKINFASYGNDLLYYNSKDYFLGSALGEVFSYVIDFKTKSFNSAHFFYTESISASLYLSPDIKSTEIKDYFIKNFKNDFPELKIVTKKPKVGVIY